MMIGSTLVFPPSRANFAHSLNRVVFSVVFCGVAVLILFYVKPPDMFDENGVPRQFGVEPDQTLLSVGSVTFLVAAITLFCFTWIDMVIGPG